MLARVRRMCGTSTCLGLVPAAAPGAGADRLPRCAAATTDFIESRHHRRGALDDRRAGSTSASPCGFRSPGAAAAILFDKYVALQRALGYKRRIPNGIVPHMGSQWWCLTRQTLSAVLQDPDAQGLRPLFPAGLDPRRELFPDPRAALFPQYREPIADPVEVRLPGQAAHLLRRSPAASAAVGLFRRAQDMAPCRPALRGVPDRSASAMNRTEPNPGKIDRIFAKAVERRTRGRSGLLHAEPLSRGGARRRADLRALLGFRGLCRPVREFRGPWLAVLTGMRVHGHLFARSGPNSPTGRTVMSGALSDSAALRDYNKRAFLTNLIWNTRGERQCFTVRPGDHIGDIRVGHRQGPQRADLGHQRGLGGEAVPVQHANFAEIRARGRARCSDREPRISTCCARNGPGAHPHLDAGGIRRSADGTVAEIIDEIGHGKPRQPRRGAAHGRSDRLRAVPAKPQEPGDASLSHGGFPGRWRRSRAAAQAGPKPYLVR